MLDHVRRVLADDFGAVVQNNGFSCYVITLVTYYALYK
jgi:hypothetical protein